NYTALSYVWGDANDLTTISTDGRPLRITTSLECALRHLRDTKRALNVWADGICINQQDETEKGRQVQQMGRVYETAAHTVIFLGEGNPAANSLLSIILSHSDDDSPIDDEDRIKALNYILQSPWFYRVWIFQELVLSK
ncbi:heterokaryon incompatibility, partial [Hyaloscypha variabilis F]